jgi:hypothetical protein
MRKPAPSPRGTNHAGLYLITNPRGAYDEALPEATGAALYAFLQPLLSEADMIEFCKLAGIDAGIGMDARRRRPAMDAAADADFAKRFPNAARIRTSL